MRTFKDGKVSTTSSDTPAEVKILSVREFLMLQLTGDFQLLHLVKDENGEVRTTTQQSRATRALVSGEIQGARSRDAVEKHRVDPEGAHEPSKAQVMTADLYGYVRNMNLILLKDVTPKGAGFNHFDGIKMVVDDVLEECDLDPSLFTSNVIRHNTEMCKIGKKMGGFSETVTGPDGDVTTKYEEGDDIEVDGVETVSFTKKGTDATYSSVWCRKLSFKMTIEAKDEDGNSYPKEVYILDLPNHPFFDSEDSTYWFGRYYWGPDFVSPVITGANLHNLGNQAITYAFGGDWVEICEENREKYLKATENCSPKAVKAAFERAAGDGKKVGGKKTKNEANLDNLVVWTNRLKFAKIYLRRSMYELCLQALLNFGEGLKKEMLKRMFELVENGTYAQNPIRQEDLLVQLKYKMKRNPSDSWDVVKGFKAWKANPKRTLEGLLEILKNVDMTTIFCRHDGAPRNGKNAGLIYDLKGFISNEIYAGFEDEETEMVFLTSKERHVIKTAEAKTKFAATEQEEVKDAVQPLIKKKAVKKKAAKKKVTKKATKKTAKKQ